MAAAEFPVLARQNGKHELMIAIVDYGMGNLGSIKNMLKKAGFASDIVCDPKGLDCADKIILPGVGAFDEGMRQIREQGMHDVLCEMVMESHVPLLGICLGMQLLTRGSEEGKSEGFGWIRADTIGFKPEDGSENLKIPHMGWNTIQTKTPSPLFAGTEEDDETRFYFVHSYHVVCDHDNNVVATTLLS